MNGKVNWNYARDVVGDSDELLLELIEIFFEEYPKLMTGIQSSITSGSPDKLRLSAHTLKGTLRYFGETQAGELAFALEVMGRDKQMEGAAEVYGKLQPELDTIVPELRAYQASHAPKSDK
ncbi:MAG: Hpt domain-containing protein [Planctomycetota bacterium]